MTSHSQGKAGGKGGLLWERSQFVLPLQSPTTTTAGGSCPKLPVGTLFPQNPLKIPWIHPLPQKSPGVWQALLLVLEETKAINNTIFVLCVITSGQQQLDVSWSNYSSSQIYILNLSFCVHPEWDILFCQTSCLAWFLTTIPLSWLRKNIPHLWKPFFTNNFVLNWNRNFHRKTSWKKYFL